MNKYAKEATLLMLYDNIQLAKHTNGRILMDEQLSSDDASIAESSDQLAYVWPNGDWCWEDEYEEYSSNKSDDCDSVTVPNDLISMGDDAIEEWVYEYSKGV